MAGVHRVLSTDGVELAAHDLGGDGPPLLLVHATGFHGHVMAPLAALLAPHFHCYAFDQRAHGDSTPPVSGRFDWHGLGDDVLAVIDSFGLSRPFAFGHSSGGAALLLAEEASPGTFRALWCYEPVVLPFDPPIGPHPDNPLADGALRRREQFASRAEAYENFSAKPPFAVLHPDALAAYVDHGFADQPDGSVRLRCHREHEAEMYRMGSAHDAFGRLGDVACPVTLACGERTDAIAPPVIALQAARLRTVRTEVLPRLGHFGPLEDPAAVAAVVLQSLRAG